MRNIYISAVNIKKGGPATILNNVLIYLLNIKNGDDIVYVITNSIYIDSIDNELRSRGDLYFLIFDWPNKSFFHRIFFEYFFLGYLLYKKSIDIWLSLNDISGFIKARKRFVYFHNPSPFISFKYFGKIPFYFYLYGFLYNIIYLINSSSYTNVFVQQSWMANSVRKRFNLNNVKIAYPIKFASYTAPNLEFYRSDKADTFVKFIFPAYPRFFKNHQIIIDAVRIVRSHFPNAFQVVFTLDGNENNYARDIYSKSNDVPEIIFIGLQDKTGMNQLYQEAHVLIFPSLLETWGLPISEAINSGIHIFAADLPYSREVVMDYSCAYFFNPIDPTSLANIMISYMNSTLNYSSNTVDSIADFNSYEQLVTYILKD